MPLIALICATHRPQNQTQKVVDLYADLLVSRSIEFRTYAMESLPENVAFADSFGKRSQEVEVFIEEILKPASHLIVVAPEYNGSFPGIFKMLIDGIHPEHFFGKKAALVGVASGRAGNLRGMDHLTDIFHHLKVEVFHHKVPISRFFDLLDEDGDLSDQNTREVLNRQLEGFLKF